MWLAWRVALLSGLQEEPGPGGEPTAAVGGGPVRPGEAALQLSHQALPRHAGAGPAADQHVLAHAAPRAHLHPHAHLPGEPSQLCHHPALRLAWTGRLDRPAFCIWPSFPHHRLIPPCSPVSPGPVPFHPPAHHALNGRVVHERGAVRPGQALAHIRCGSGLKGRPCHPESLPRPSGTAAVCLS